MNTRPVVLVDLDNVVMDWVKNMALWLDDNGALDHLKEEKIYRPLDIEHPILGFYQVSDIVNIAMAKYSQWSVWDDWKIPKGEFMRWWRLGIEAGEVYGNGPLIEGAREALWKLSDAEWNIHIVSNRLSKFGLHDQILINTAKWLKENNIPYRDFSLTSDKHSIHADAMIDDRADNMNTESHGTCFLFPAAHNQALSVNSKFIVQEPGITSDRAWKNIVNSLTS